MPLFLTTIIAILDRPYLVGPFSTAFWRTYGPAIMRYRFNVWRILEVLDWEWIQIMNLRSLKKPCLSLKWRTLLTLKVRRYTTEDSQPVPAFP